MVITLSDFAAAKMTQVQKVKSTLLAATVFLFTSTRAAGVTRKVTEAFLYVYLNLGCERLCHSQVWS